MIWTHKHRHSNPDVFKAKSQEWGLEPKRHSRNSKWWEQLTGYQLRPISCKVSLLLRAFLTTPLLYPPTPPLFQLVSPPNHNLLTVATPAPDLCQSPLVGCLRKVSYWSSSSFKTNCRNHKAMYNFWIVCFRLSFGPWLSCPINHSQWCVNILIIIITVISYHHSQYHC